MLFLWQGLVARGAGRRRTGAVVGRWIRHRPWLLTAALAAKAVFLAAVLVQVLPATLAGFGTTMKGAIADPMAREAFGVIALAIGAWLVVRPRHRVSDRGVGAAAAILVGAFETPFVLSAIVLLLVPVLGLLDELAGRPPLAAIPLDCSSIGQPSFAAVGFCIDERLLPAIDQGAGLSVIVGAVLAIVLWRNPSSRPVSIALAVALAWIGAKTVGHVSLVTVDLFLTIVLGALASLWWTGRQHRVGPAALGTLLVVSTLLSYAGDVAFTHSESCSYRFRSGWHDRV